MRRPFGQQQMARTHDQGVGVNEIDRCPFTFELKDSMTEGIYSYGKFARRKKVGQ